MKKLPKDCSIVIKPDGKSSCVVLWDKKNYFLGAEKRQCDTNIYQEVKLGDNQLAKLVEDSNRMF